MYSAQCGQFSHIRWLGFPNCPTLRYSIYSVNSCLWSYSASIGHWNIVSPSLADEFCLSLVISIVCWKNLEFFFLNFKCSNIDDFLLTNFLTSFPFSAPSNCCILHFIDWADQKIKGLRLLLLRIKKVPILICKFKRKSKRQKKERYGVAMKEKNYSTWFLHKFERLLCFSMLLWF